MNTALQMCNNDIVGVFDAESIAAPSLLANIDASFRETGRRRGAGRGPARELPRQLVLLRNCLEYFIWFRSRLHAHARLGFIPLGGNTVFVRRSLLERDRRLG